MIMALPSAGEVKRKVRSVCCAVDYNGSIC